MQYPADNSPLDELVQEMMHINPEEISEVVEEVNEIDASTQSLEAPSEQKNQEETAQADEQDEQSKTDQDAVETAESSLLPPEIPDEVPKLDLKPLPSSLRYEFLGDNKTYPVIVNYALNFKQTEKLLTLLQKHRGALGYTLNDIKGISPSICMHRIMMEEDHKPTVEGQRRFNPNLRSSLERNPQTVGCQYHLLDI